MARLIYTEGAGGGGGAAARKRRLSGAAASTLFGVELVNPETFSGLQQNAFNALLKQLKLDSERYKAANKARVVLSRCDLLCTV